VPVHDQYAAALGTGVIQPGDVMFGAGTAWVLLAISRELPPLVIPSAYVCNHVVAGLHGQLLSLHNGGSSFSWARKFAGLDRMKATELDTKMGAIKPGGDGLGFWPFLAAANPPGLEPGTKGRITGLQLFHQPEHLLRAVIEGLAFELNRHLHMLRQDGNARQRLVMSGGAAQSTITPQIIADVTGLDVACCPGEGGSLSGAVILARSLVEPRATLSALATDMVPAMAVVSPGSNAKVYQELCAQYINSLPMQGLSPAVRCPAFRLSGLNRTLKRGHRTTPL